MQKMSFVQNVTNEHIQPGAKNVISCLDAKMSLLQIMSPRIRHIDEAAFVQKMSQWMSQQQCHYGTSQTAWCKKCHQLGWCKKCH